MKVARHKVKWGALMKTRLFLMCAVLFCGLASHESAYASPCLKVTLTGTQSGPPIVAGLAGAGTLVEFGEEANQCKSVRLQFDAGRGTLIRLSQAGVLPQHLNAVFFTHMHSDHSEGFPEIAQLRWNFSSKGPKLDVICSNDAKAPLGYVMSCKKFAQHIGDPLIQSGEIAQRISEDTSRLPGGPADIVNVINFEPKEEVQNVWALGDVKVSAIRSTHIAGHASFRVDTPAGSVVIGGDAGNDTFAPPRKTSTSDQVEKLARGADILVHSTMHPVMAPDKDSGMPAGTFYRQSLASDLGGLALRSGVKHLMLTHLAPSLGAVFHGPYKVPGGPLTVEDYRKAVETSGFKGSIIVGADLSSLTIPVK
jgi:ribonuclease Z